MTFPFRLAISKIIKNVDKKMKNFINNSAAGTCCGTESMVNKSRKLKKELAA